MQVDKDLINSIQQKADQRILYLPHAVRQMARPERMISTSEIRYVIRHGKIIEDYPNDVRGHSTLIMGKGDMGRTIHLVCSPKEEYLAVITAYIPSLEDWEDGFEERKKS